MSAPLDADVVIIGSGVAGSLIAWRLAEAKLKVLILEAGPRIDRVEAFKSYLAARDKNASAPYPPAPYAPAPQYNAWNDYYINTGPDLFRGMYTRGVGGSTWHWAGSVLRYRPSDFRMKSRFGVGVDWPISYEELAPFYDEAERVLGVAGSNTESWGAPRASEYPMPAIPPSYLDTVVGGVLGPLGMSLSVFPQARNSVLYDERPQCCGNASCVPLCPIGAKYDASFHATKAEKAGARLETGAVVHRIEMDANHVASATVHFRRPDGSEGTAVGRMVVLAAHAIETPKLLLMSRDERTPKGVANSSDTVGRYLMSHIDQGTRGLTGAPIYPYRGPVITSAIREFRDGAFRQNHSAIGTSISNEGWRHLGPQATANALIDQGLAGQRLKNAIAWRTERELTLGSTAETLPDPANRIVPDKTRTDAIGIPRPRIHYRIDDYAKAGLALAMRRHEAIFAALQSTEIETLPMVTSSGTILGTTRMGNDPRDSVVDRDLRAHDHANLFIVGGMVFPTAGMHPPTLTIAALALRAAELIQQGFAGQH